MAVVAESQCSNWGPSVFVQGTTGDAADGKEMKFAEAPGTGRVT